MDPETKAKLFEQGGKVVSAAIKLVVNRPRKTPTENTEETEETSSTAPVTPEVTETARQHKRIEEQIAYWQKVQNKRQKREVEDFTIAIREMGLTGLWAKGNIPQYPGYVRIGNYNVTYEKAIGDVIDRLLVSRVTDPAEQCKKPSILRETITPEVTPRTEPQPHSSVSLPTSEETAVELKRRLGRELYKAELDLAAGLKIAGKPCDCLSNKHTLFLEAASEELIPQDPDNHVYQDVIQWIKNNQHKVTVEAIQSGKYAAEYPHMANEFKNFRKRVMGSVGTTESPAATITLAEAKKLAAEEATKEVERQWTAQKP